MTWHVAPAIVSLRDQIDAAYPGRDRRSDGTIGDANHAAHVSDHNPDASGAVCAWDVTHGPFWGTSQLDCVPLANELVAQADPRIGYLIFQRRIWQPGIGWSGYSGPSPHLEHLHLSIRHGHPADDARPWVLPLLGNVPLPPQFQTNPGVPAVSADARIIQHDNSNPALNGAAKLIVGGSNGIGGTAFNLDGATYDLLRSDFFKVPVQVVNDQQWGFWDRLTLDGTAANQANRKNAA